MIGKKIKELRIKANLTQEELANKLFVSRSLVAKWEQGNSIPSKDYIEKLCSILNCQIYEIVGVEADNQQNKKTHINKIIIALGLLLIISIIFTSFLCIYFDKRDFYYLKQFSPIIQKQWLIEDLSMPNNKFMIKHDQYQLVYASSEQEFDNYCKYVTNYLQANNKIDSLYYIKKLDEHNRKCYLSSLDSYYSCFLDDKLFNIYYIQNDSYYLISLKYDDNREIITIRLGTDIYISENNNRTEIDYTVIFEGVNE